MIELHECFGHDEFAVERRTLVSDEISFATRIQPTLEKG